MYLLYELKNKTYVLNILDIKNNNFIKKVFNYNIEKLKITTSQSKEPKIFLLDDERFDFFSFDIKHKIESKFNIKDFKKDIEDKKVYINTNYGKSGMFLSYSTDGLCVDGQTTDYIIGKNGLIEYRINFVYLNKLSVLMLKNLLGPRFNEDLNLKVFPQSYYTSLYLKQKLNRNKLNLLYIGETELKLVIIENGFYSRIVKIPMGIDKLKGIFRDNNVLLTYYQSFKNSDFNELSLNLLKESFRFYVKMLVKWLYDNIGNRQDCIIISSLLQNQYFIEIFNQEYMNQINGYVLPFHQGNELDMFGKKWDPDKTDILIALNNL